VRQKNADKYQKTLSKLQLVLLIDRSYSMMNGDNYAFSKYNPAPQSKFVTAQQPTDFSWKRMDSAFLVASPLANTMLKYDKDRKVPVYFFGSHVHQVEI